MFETIAAKHGVTSEEVRAEIGRAITLAWRNPANRVAIQRITGSLVKPDPEDLILAIAAQAFLET